MSDPLHDAWRRCRQAIDDVAGPGRRVVLVAASKAQPLARVRALAAAGQRDFGENYVQEALARIAGCADLDLVWHFIGPLQSNKAREVARHFDWLHSLDRDSLLDPLDRHRPAASGPLQVLVQVNIDGEAGKSGCAPQQVPALADAVAARPNLRLRGLMAIPRPDPDPARRRAAFAAMAALFADLRARHPEADTLSMGMSEDWPLAVAEGATLVRIGSALFGPRPAKAAAAQD